jgi:hypothetical protein
MARRRALSQREVDGLREIGMHWVAENLYVQIREQGTRSWLFRYWVDGKPKVIGLGPTRDVTLAEARDKADRLRIQLRDGADPAGESQAAGGRAARKLMRHTWSQAIRTLQCGAAARSC